MAPTIRKFGTLLCFVSTTYSWTPSSTLNSSRLRVIGGVSRPIPASPYDVDLLRIRLPATVTLSRTSLRASTVEINEIEEQQTTSGDLVLQVEASTVMEEATSELDLSQKIINGVFLAAAFGYALFTILNIDHGLTRGWSAGEIAMRIPLDNWGSYESSLANQPVMTKTLINVIIYLLGDWLSQTAFAGKNVLDFDISRTLRNGFIGLCFGPLVHEYYQFSDAILPPEDGIFVRLQKILMDQTLYLTVKCSMYIAAVGLLAGDDVQTVKKTVEDRIGGVVFTAWKFWPIVHCITYGLVPARHRILWVNSVDLIWNAILASQAQKEPEGEVADEVGLKSAELEPESSLTGEVTNNKMPAPVLVLDNQWVEGQKESVAEIISSTVGGVQSNTTADATAVA